MVVALVEVLSIGKGILSMAVAIVLPQERREVLVMVLFVAVALVGKEQVQ